MHQRVFLSNCQNVLGSAICYELLYGEHRQHFPKVVGCVTDTDQSMDLWAYGACLVNFDADDETLQSFLQGITTLILTPAYAEHKPVERAERLLKLAKQSGVKHVVLVTKMGIEDEQSEAMTPVTKVFRQIENLVNQSGLRAWMIRHAPLHQNLFLWAPMIRDQKKLCMPFKENAQFTKVNLEDVTTFLSYMLANESSSKDMSREMRRSSSGSQLQSENKRFCLTGMEKCTGKTLVEELKQQIQQDVQFHEISRQELQQYLQQYWNFNQQTIEEIMDEIELIRRGKLTQISDDQKKNSGKEPKTFKAFLQRNGHHFAPLKSGQQ